VTRSERPTQTGGGGRREKKMATGRAKRRREAATLAVLGCARDAVKLFSAEAVWNRRGVEE
jgi:hypothetical protein